MVQHTKKGPKKPTRGKRESASPKVLAEKNFQCFSEEMKERKDQSLALLKEDVQNAEKYRQESLALKKENNEIRKKKFKLLKRLLQK